jgi:hypothetical protein
MSRFSFQLVSDNYTAVPSSPDAFPAASYSKKTSGGDFIEE